MTLLRLHNSNLKDGAFKRALNPSGDVAKTKPSVAMTAALVHPVDEQVSKVAIAILDLPEDASFILGLRGRVDGKFCLPAGESSVGALDEGILDAALGSIECEVNGLGAKDAWMLVGVGAIGHHGSATLVEHLPHLRTDVETKKLVGLGIARDCSTWRRLPVRIFTALGHREGFGEGRTGAERKQKGDDLHDGV